MEEEYYRQQQDALQQDRDTRRASRKVETYTDAATDTRRPSNDGRRGTRRRSNKIRMEELKG